MSPQVQAVAPVRQLRLFHHSASLCPLQAIIMGAFSLHPSLLLHPDSVPHLIPLHLALSFEPN